MYHQSFHFRKMVLHLIVVLLVMPVLIGCGSKNPAQGIVNEAKNLPQEIVNEAKIGWDNTSLFHSISPEETLTPFEVTNWEKITLPASYKDLANIDGYGSEIYCLAFKPTLYDCDKNFSQCSWKINNLIIVQKGKKWVDIGGAWNQYHSQWIRMLCNNRGENDVECGNLTVTGNWIGVGDTMLKNAGCPITEKK